MTPSSSALRQRLAGLMIRDQHRLSRSIDRAERQAGHHTGPDLAGIEAEIEAAERRRAARAAHALTISYPPELPVAARREEIMAAIRSHQVVVVAGETGSGKTTQIPKMCLELGRGIAGSIGHTQPRRIAARTVAERLADELGVPLGNAVGYAVRFTDTVGETTLVKVMTDGILLAEIRGDRLLTAYDTVIVDEAHERSLNIDFLLGYLVQLLPRRPDLKVIITSATIDTARFAAHFSAPVVEVSGRNHPVEIRYRPVLADGDRDGERDRDINEAICDAVGELAGDGHGDLLVFLPGERDIRDAADALRASGPQGLEIVPLYARLSAAEQHRVFRPHRGRRVVLATNVAETSLTVPGIRYVIDTGLARVSRFNHRTKVQRLPIEAVSQASANQRAGRCGRIGPGVCIRLYSEDDFARRPDFTEPEILRTNLASVMLQMAAIGLGGVETFPFIEPPDRRSVADGRALLEELGAVEADGRGTRLTPTGRRLAQLPLDPRLARMVVEAQRRDCLREVTIIAAALSIQDPRERPADQAQEADRLHSRFVVDGSDFLGYVELWDYLAELQADLSGNQFRKRCRSEYLNVLRIREWQDVAGQIRQIYRAEGIRPNHVPAAPEQVHQALLTGLLSHLGARDRVRNDYLGARHTRWQIARSSVLARRPPDWAMAGALVETGRTWARTAARVEPQWAERAGAHLIRRSYSEPWWDSERGEAMTDERVTLYGLPLVPGRAVSLHRTDAAAARHLFIQRALVDRDWPVDLAPLARTEARKQTVRALEDRVRRRNLLTGDDELFAFYDSRVPAEVWSGSRFLRWWRRTEATDPDLLDVPLSLLLDRTGGPIDISAYPDRWAQGDLRLPLRYRFEPGDPSDGVTVQIPLVALNRVHLDGFDWNVEGFRPELVATLVRSLPRQIRRSVGPASEVTAELLSSTGPSDGPLFAAVARRLARMTGQPVTPDTWGPHALPDHLRMKFEVVDPQGRIAARGTDLERLGRELRDQVRTALSETFPGLEVHGATGWVFGDLPAVVERGAARAYPALVDEGDTVGVALLETEAAQADSMWRATRRLLLLGSPLPGAHLQRRLSNETRQALAASDVRLVDLLEDCADAAVDQIMVGHGGPAFDQAGFEAMASVARDVIVDRVVRLATIAGGVVAAAVQVRERADQIERRDGARNLASALGDVRRQVGGLVHPGFVATAGAVRLGNLLRYLAAADRRLERLPSDARRDQERQAVVDGVSQRYERMLDLVAAGTAGPGVAAGLAEVRWMIEELRVSLWAQSLGTPKPISPERIFRALDALDY